MRKKGIGGVIGLFGLLLAALGVGGCASLMRRGPVAENVVTCRQLSQRGTEAMQRGDWSHAEAFFASAIGACPVDERARRGYAETLWHRGAKPAAISQMEEAARLSGGDAEMRVRLGQMHLAEGRLDKAERQARMAIAANSSLAAAWALRGDVQRRRGKLSQALADYHRALSCRKDFPDVQLQIAEIYHEQGRPQRALATLESLGDQYPQGEEPPRILFLKGLALEALNRYEDAVETLNAAARQGPPDAEVLYRLAEAQLLAGHPASAQLAVLDALRIDPDHLPSRRLLERVRAMQERVASAK